MAIFHMDVKVGNRKNGGSQNHGRYIRRDPRILISEHHPADSWQQNLPTWAADPDYFWKENDERERKNGSVYREFEVSLAIELSQDQSREMVKNWVAEEFPNQFCEVGFHWKSGNPHAHIQVCERMHDGINRTPENYFKRRNPAKPELGGCEKSDRFTANYLKQEQGEERKDFMRRQRTERKSALFKIRGSWASACNEHLAQHGHAARVDHRSNRERGIETAPGVHLGRAAVALEKQGIRTERALMARATEERRTGNELRRQAEKRTGPADQSIDKDGLGRAVQRDEQSQKPRFASPEKIDSGGGRKQPPPGFSKVENWSDRDCSWLELESNFVRPAAVSLTKIQREGFLYPAYFSASRKIGGAPICIKKYDGEFVVLDAKKISVEELKAVLQLASGDSGGVVLTGTPDFCQRAEALAKQMGLEVEHPHQVSESERKEAEERYKMVQASIEDAPRPHP